jgi:dehydrogenase/reductase SDR family protein 7B
MKQLKDKVIWITGASSGIGEALALKLASENARLVLSARREDELQRVAKLTALAPLDVMVLPFDLADTSNASGLAAQVMNKFGRIDVLVNNGGMSQRSEAMDTSSEIERMLMEVNYFAQVNLAKAVLPYMIRQKQGQIVVISSIAGKFGFFLRSSYSAAKHALFGYFESLRLEVEKKGIDVLLVSPGKVKTNVSVNAVGPGGKPHKQIDPSHEQAMSAEKCAEIICKSLLTKKTELLVGGKELLLVRIKNYIPSLFRYIVKRQDPF